MNLIKFFFTFLIFSFLSCSDSNKYLIKSPDEKVKLTFKVEDGKAFYKVDKLNRSVTNWSRLGMVLGDGKDLGEGLKVNKTSKEKISNKWLPIIGEKTEVNDNYTKLSISLVKEGTKYDIIFRVYN